MNEVKSYLVEPVCKLGVWDATIPGIEFDEQGVSNYAKVQQQLMKDSPRGEEGLKRWNAVTQEMKNAGRKCDYDCIMGVSGGTDSSYLLHVAKGAGLRVLAVNIDNGFNSDIAVKNIKKVTSKLDIDFYTYVIDYEEMKAVLKSYMKASLPWIDNPTDRAIKSTLFKIANKHGIKYILSGTDFRSEGMQPNEWTYSDVKQLKFLNKKFGSIKFKSYPYIGLLKLAYFSRVKGVKRILPFNFINYQKKQAQDFLQKEYGWEYYGGHHHENAFTKFVVAYWLPYKFGIDKRKITLSAQILSGEITRDQALDILSSPAMDMKDAEDLKKYVIKKLEMSQSDFDTAWQADNKYYYNYPNNFNLLVKYKKLAEKIFRKTYTSRPKSFYQIEMRSHGNKG